VPLVSPLLLLTVLYYAAAIQSISKDQYPLRSGCSETDALVGSLPAGSEVQVKFSLALGGAPCYLVSATLDGKVVEGYVHADGLADPQQIERERKAAPAVVSTGGPPPPPPPPVRTPAQMTHPDVERALDLLRRNQPAEALAILEALLKKYPNHPDLLALAGHAAYRSDRMVDALDYWRKSLDLKPDMELEQAYVAARREASADQSTQRKFGTRFVLRYDGAVADSATATAIISLLEQEFSRLTAQLGCRSDERIVTIVQSREAYLRSTAAAPWSAGAYDGKIRVPLVEANQITPQIRKTFAHELVHACLANIGPWPTWFHEGMAQKFSGDFLSPEKRALLESAGKAGKLPKFSEMGRDWSVLPGAGAALAYDYSLLGVELFLQYHSAFGVRNLLNNPGQLPRITADLDRRIRDQ